MRRACRLRTYFFGLVGPPHEPLSASVGTRAFSCLLLRQNFDAEAHLCAFCLGELAHVGALDCERELRGDCFELQQASVL